MNGANRRRKSGVAASQLKKKKKKKTHTLCLSPRVFKDHGSPSRLVLRVSVGDTAAIVRLVVRAALVLCDIGSSLDMAALESSHLPSQRVCTSPISICLCL